MSANEIEDIAPDFPAAARAFLNAFYKAKNANTDEEKIISIKEGFQLENSDAYGSDNELQLLEFYVLTKRGVI